MKALLGFAPLLGRQKGRLARALLLSLLTLAAGVGLLGVSGWFLTAAALSTAGAAFNLFGPSATIRGLSFVRILARYGERLAGHDATLRLLSDLRRWLLGRLFAAVPLPGAGLTRADLVSRLVADVEALDTAFLTALGPMATALLVGTAMGLGLATLLPGAALAYGACYLLAAVIVPVGLIAGGAGRARRSLPPRPDCARRCSRASTCTRTWWRSASAARRWPGRAPPPGDWPTPGGRRPGSRRRQTRRCSCSSGSPWAAR